MILASHQPNYIPNLGFFYKMGKADTYVIFSNLQFSKRDGWVRKHKIKGPNKDIWLTVPTHCNGAMPLIKNVFIDNTSKWSFRHRETIKQAYAKTSEQEALKKILEIYNKKWERLVDVNFALITCIKDILQINTNVILDEDICGEKQDLLINVCKKYDADTYLSGMGGKLYMTDKHYSEFVNNNITNTFVERDLTSMYPYSALHYIFTEGVETVREMLETRQTIHIPV